MGDNELNCLSYWFPKLVAAGVPVPGTQIVTMPADLRSDFFAVFDGEPLSDRAKAWCAELGVVAATMGSPCFLRTGQTSGKHNWSQTCYVADAAKIESHVLALIEFSECCDFMGLPWDVWCVREMLPTEPVGVAEDYGGMPFCREVRCFVRDGRIVCEHPYWPKQSIADGLVCTQEMVGHPLRKIVDAIYDALSGNTFGLLTADDGYRPLVEATAKVFDGAWSVDVLKTSRGWFVTDMALAHRSFHWDGCKQAAQFQQAKGS